MDNEVMTMLEIFVIIGAILFIKFFLHKPSNRFLEHPAVKKSIEELITKNNLNKTQTAEDCGINRLTLRIATKIGNQVSLETARSISRYFNVFSYIIVIGFLKAR